MKEKCDDVIIFSDRSAEPRTGVGNGSRFRGQMYAEIDEIHAREEDVIQR
jgi:hypothetical protein